MVLVIHKIEIAGNLTEIETPEEFGPLLVEAMATMKQYKATIPNPDIDPTAEVDPEAEPLPELIPNPTTKERFCAEQIVKYCRQIVVGYRAKIGSESLKETETAQNETDHALVKVL